LFAGHRVYQILAVCLQDQKCAKHLSFTGLVVSSGTTGKGLLKICYFKMLFLHRFRCLALWGVVKSLPHMSQ